MKPESRRTGAIIVSVVLLLCAAMFSAIAVSLLLNIKDITPEQIGFIIVFGSIVDIVFICIAIHTLTKGLKVYRNMTKGRKREGKIVEIINSKQSTLYKEVTVAYRGESGDKHELIVPMLLGATNKLRVGQIIECYVCGESCYVDVEQPIKILKEPEEELEFE